MSLVVDVATVLPIGELCHIAAHLLSRGIALRKWSELTLRWQNLEWSECCIVSCGQLHRVWVDDTSLFF